MTASSKAQRLLRLAGLLIWSLRTLVEGVPRPRVRLNLPNDLIIGDPRRAHTILRCVQEIVTNTVKHADATNLWIDLIRTSDGLEVRARDDGRGAERVRMGQGLAGMRARLEEIGGRLEIDSKTSQGFSINAWLPLSESA